MFFKHIHSYLHPIFYLSNNLLANKLEINFVEFFKAEAEMHYHLAVYPSHGVAGGPNHEVVGEPNPYYKKVNRSNFEYKILGVYSVQLLGAVHSLFYEKEEKIIRVERKGMFKHHQFKLPQHFYGANV